MGSGTDARIVGSNLAVGEGRAHVTDNALHVKVVSGTVTANVPERSAITQMLNAVVFDTTVVHVSASFDCTKYRWLIVYIDISKANNPGTIRIGVEFDRGGGNWVFYSVDQWVDLRFAAAQVPLVQAIPLNYVVGKTIRISGLSTGTNAVDTFTVSAWVEAVT